MRRTTICRSSASITAAALLALVSVSAAAQQPPAAPPPAAPNAPAQAAPIGPPPATHVVQQGETLWSLAQQFLGDALLWPEIYRLNTNVVEDPHWIFPGEELRMVATDEPVAAPGAVNQNVTVTPTADTSRPTLPPARAMQVPTIFSPTLNASPRPSPDAIEIQNQRAYRAVREGEYYSAGFLTENQPLTSGRLLGGVQTPSVRRLTSSSTAMLFADVVIRPPAGDPVQRGDMMLTYRNGGEIRGYGDIILPTGLLRVSSTGESGGNIIATVVAVYGQISDGQSLIKVAPFRFPANARSTEVADGVVGQVVGLRNAREVLGLQDVLFINRGADEGVRLGDVFALTATVRTDNGTVEQDKARALVVSTREHTSTIVLVEIYRPDIGPGATARQIRRMPS